MGVIAAGLAVAAVGAVGSAVAGAVAGGKKEDAAGQRFDHAFAAADAGNKAAERAEQKALPSPQELRALEGTLKSQEMTIEREQKLIEAVDPALMEAGKQAYDMLKGKETEMLGPVRRQRERQKQQMKDTLRRQMGPGFETSSAGIEAMTKFDMETSDLMAQTQQNAVNGMLGISANAAAMGRSSEAGAQGRMLQTGQVFGDIQKRQTQAAQFSASQFIQGGQLIDQASAGRQVAAGASAEAVGQGFGQVAKLGGFMASGGMSSMGGGGGDEYDFSQADGVGGGITKKK